MFDENSCTKNIITTNKDEIVAKIVDKLHTLLKEDIKTEVIKVMEKY